MKRKATVFILALVCMGFQASASPGGSHDGQTDPPVQPLDNYYIQNFDQVSYYIMFKQTVTYTPYGPPPADPGGLRKPNDTVDGTFWQEVPSHDDQDGLVGFNTAIPGSDWPNSKVDRIGMVTSSELDGYGPNLHNYWFVPGMDKDNNPVYTAVSLTPWSGSHALPNGNADFEIHNGVISVFKRQK